MRQELIDQITTLIQQDLEKWAKDNNILEPGEHIVFSMRIEVVPSVVREEDISYQELSIDKFFSVGRLKSVGMRDRNSIGRTRAVFMHFGVRNHGDPVPATMKEFVEKYPDVLDIDRHLGSQKKTLRKVVELLRSSGFRITDQDHLLD